MTFFSTTNLHQQNIPSHYATTALENKPNSFQKTTSKVSTTFLESEQCIGKGLIWTAATLTSGVTTLATGLLTAVTYSIKPETFTFSYKPSFFKFEPISFEFKNTFDIATPITLSVMTIGLTLLTIKCFEHMSSHLGVSHKIVDLQD